MANFLILHESSVSSNAVHSKEEILKIAIAFSTNKTW